MNAHGFVHKYGDNVDTDVIIPARYLTTSVPEELAAHCMEDIDREFIHKVKPGDIMVADKNFGCGSSREHAPIGPAVPALYPEHHRKRRPAEQHPVGIGENQHRSALDSHKKGARNNLFRAPFLLSRETPWGG